MAKWGYVRHLVGGCIERTEIYIYFEIHFKELGYSCFVW